MFDNGILSVIQARHLWKDTTPHPDQLNVPTRRIRHDRIDTIITTEHGDRFCVCPQTTQIRAMQSQGVEMSRRSVKWGCSAAVYDLTCEATARCRLAAASSDDCTIHEVRLSGSFPGSTATFCCTITSFAAEPRCSCT